MLVAQDNPRLGYWVDDLGTGVNKRSQFYTYRTTWSIAGGVVLTFLSFCLVPAHPIFILSLLLGLAVLALGIYFAFSKPKALEQHKQLYIRKLQDVAARSMQQYQPHQIPTFQNRYDEGGIQNTLIAEGQPISDADEELDVALANNNALGKNKDDVEKQQSLI
eukprot:TRINITY_DN414_c1_g2_i1.p1 TRINITY_DN414_c1_g2~~TRINITY_DN414_c1_g2_i1.p1  ORF type:complete len:163 (+),score=32.93 TRINITY_DN414_c1_g2_i1:1-489(+)